MPNVQQNFQEEVENYDPTTRSSGEVEYEDVAIPYADEPLASHQFSKKSIGRGVKAEVATKRAELRTMPQIRHCFSRPRELPTRPFCAKAFQICKFHTL